MKLSEQIETLKSKINSLESDYVKRIDEIDDDLAKNSDVLKIASENWAGNWTEYTDYYNNFFESNGEQHIQLNYDRLLDIVNQNSAIPLKSLIEEMMSISENFKEFNVGLEQEWPKRTTQMSTNGLEKED